MSLANHSAGPTPRRSTRLSTKASSVADTMVTNVTAGGSRLRKGPLTKVKARKSSAYGASGRVGAAEELTVATTGFATAFKSQRGDAFDRDDDHEDDHEDDDEDEDEDELGADETPRATGLSFLESDEPEASLGDTSKSFGVFHEAGMLLPQGTRIQREFRSFTPVPPPRTSLFDRRGSMLPPAPPAAPLEQPKRVTPRPAAGERLQPGATSTPQPRRAQSYQAQGQNPQQVNEWLLNVQDFPKEGDGDAQWPYTKVLKWLLWCLTAIAAFALITAYASSPSGTPGSRSSIRGLGSAVSARVSYTMNKVVDYIQPPRELTEEEKKEGFRAGKGVFLWDRMSDIYWELRKRTDRMNETVISVTEDVDYRLDNFQTIIDHVRDQLPDNLIVTRHKDGRSEISDEFWLSLMDKAQRKENSAEWQGFLQRNSEKLEAIYNDRHERSDTATYAGAVAIEEFVTLIEQKYKEISIRVDQKIAENLEAQRNHIKTVVESEARNTLMDTIRLQSLAQSILVSNFELHLRQPNYFSPGLGAYVDPKLTSITYGDDVGFFRKISILPTIRPAKAALLGWNEPGECWCAAPSPSDKTQAQLTVSLGRPMVPKKVTVEHIPMSMAPARKLMNAPRTVEVWVETEAPLNYYYNERQARCSTEIPGWKCLGSVKYNIHAANHVQTFELAAEPSTPITKTMVRVVNNWGADHTCLYRLRLHGDDAEPDFDHQVRLNDE